LINRIILIMKKQKVILFLAGFLLIPTLIVSYYFVATHSGSDLASIEAKSKSKWQKLLEKNGIDQSFWKKYLPYIRQSEYSKAMKKYKASKYVASSISYGDGIHRNISTTLFWAGEPADDDNKGISNCPSAWDDNWAEHFCGTKNFGKGDDPDNRSGYFPAQFTPTKENPFYFALPYNDFDNNGNRKAEASKIIPWANEKAWGKNESMCKNHWIKITHDGKVAYAQWEDVGPWGETDANYVFGSAAPQCSDNDNVGLDVSPAVNDYLGLEDIDKTDWQFVDEKDVPDGPWKQIKTTRQVSWN